VFKITARTVLELGSELISSDIIAFYELVKNAFDAGSPSGADIHLNVVLRRNEYLRIRALATELQPGNAEALSGLASQVSQALDSSAESARIETFRTQTQQASSSAEFIAKLDQAYAELNTIEVLDSGSGMSLSEMTENFLTIGTASRKREVEAAVKAGHKKSPYLGEKGIGRLSAMRLGERLLVESARKQDERIGLLEIDWKKFADLGAMIEDIPLMPTVGPEKPDPQWSGTRLVIGDLTEDWTEKRLSAFATYNFSRITDPFVDPKLKPRIALHWNGSRIAVPWMDRTLIASAHASFRGKYIADGKEPRLEVRLEAVNLGYEHSREVDSVVLTLPDLEGLVLGTGEEVPQSALASLGSFEFEAYWYNRRHLAGIDTIGNQRVVRDLQKQWSGILLFRDGFRVFPYGEDDDDWLGLDRKALGRPGYVLNKAQFVGRVNISRSQNPRLVDQTSREGLRSTPEQEVFVALLQRVIRDDLWDFFREIDRKYKKQPIEISDLKAEVNQLGGRAKTALTKVRKLVPRDQSALVDDLQHAFNEFQDLSERAQRRIEEVEEDGRQMVHMAGLGLMVEVVAHELARASESALQALEGLRGKDVPAEIRAKLEILRSEMKSVSKRLRVLDQLSVSGRQRAETFDLGELLDDLEDGHRVQFHRHNITLKIDKPKGPIRVKLVKGLVVQILENLVSNSMYWVQMRVGREARYTPEISIQVEAVPPTIYFSDNGPGISPEHRERIFRPFWSLKDKTRRRGLGLFIGRENATYLGGNLRLSDKADPITGRLHEFVLALPDNSVVK
jgi:signal transduction histidine kinase